jgi:hypothetical protein
MNKLTILVIIVISWGLITSQALAADALSASDFFYGESVDNNNPVINTSDHRVIREAASPENLAAADFFYGQPIDVQSEILKGDDRPQRTEVAATPGNLITPEIFYGYTDVIEEKAAPCVNC